jgi:hypothetical protein
MVLAFTAPGLSQASTSSAKPSVLPVKVQVDVMRSAGTRMVRSPYSLITSSSGENAVLRIGAEVPLSAAGGQVTLQQIGTQIECSVTAPGDDRFNLKLTLRVSFLSPDGQPRSITSTNTFTLKDKESTKFTGSDDGGGAFTVDVTLTTPK